MQSVPVYTWHVALLELPGHLREKLEDLLTEVDDMSKVWPHILMQGDMDNEAEYTIVVDGHFALKAKTFTRAVKLLFASYYVFNICYPKELVNTLTFLQQAILNLDGGKRSNKVVSLLAKVTM